MALDDYITAKDINSAANTLAVMNRNDMARRQNARAEETHERNMNALDEADKLRGETNLALGHLQKGEDIPGDAGYTPSAIAAAQGAYSKQRTAESNISNLDLAQAVTEKENEIFAELGKHTAAGGNATEFLKGMVPESSVDMQAMINARKRMSTMDKLNYNNMQTIRNTAKLKYEEHKGKLTVASKYLQAGNAQLAEQVLLSAVNDTPHPVYMEKNPNGTYDLYFEEAGKDKQMLSQGNDVTLEQAAELIGSIPPQQAMMTFAADMELAQKTNSEARPVVWQNDKGEKVEVFSLVNPMNPREHQYVVFEHHGGRLDNVTPETLRQNGYRQEADLDTQIKQAKLRKASKEANAAGGMDYKTQNQMLDGYKKQMTLLLSPWTKGNEDMSNMDFSNSGTGPLKLAMDYYNNNRQAFETGHLQGAELEKFQNAAEAMKLHHRIRQVVGGLNQFQGDAAQMPDHTKRAVDLADSGDEQALKEYLTALSPEVQAEVTKGMREEAERRESEVPNTLEHNQLSALDAAENGTEDARKPEARVEGAMAAAEDAPKAIGELNGKAVGASKHGYVIQDENGSWREPTPEEADQIRAMASKGQLTSPTAWEYENKYPGGGIGQQRGIGQGGRGLPSSPILTTPFNTRRQ